MKIRWKLSRFHKHSSHGIVSFIKPLLLLPKLLFFWSDLNLVVFFINGIQNILSFFPKLLMSSKVSGSSKSAVSGRKTPGTLPSNATIAISRKGAALLKTLWKKVFKSLFFHQGKTYRINNCWCGHHSNHGHDIDQCNSTAPQTCGHHLHSELETHVVCIRCEESSQHKCCNP